MQGVVGLLVLVPVAMVAVCILVCYLLATMVEGLPFFLPSLSELGSLPPGSCIYSFAMASCAFLFAWMFYVRFKDVHQTVPVERFRTLNRVAFLFAAGFCLGLLLVSTFQARHIPVVHYVGSALVFFCASVYFFLMAGISVKVALFRLSLTRATLRARFVLAAFHALFFVLAVVFVLVWVFVDKASPTDRFWWSLGAVFEWAAALTNGLYLLTFYSEMRLLGISLGVEELRDNSSLNDSAKLLA